MPVDFLGGRYPGIFVEYDERDQSGLSEFVSASLDRLSTQVLGKQFLAEFAPAKGKPSHGDDYKNFTLGIYPPIVTQASKVLKRPAKLLTGIMETKDSKRAILAATHSMKSGLAPGEKSDPLAQEIHIWWPKSENTSLYRGIQVMPEVGQEGAPNQIDTTKIQPAKEWVENTIKLQAFNKHGELLPHKFQYHGHNQTFFIAFVHEMIHAYRGLTGQAANTVEEEETATVGLHGAVNNTYTENKFRALFNVKLRPDYKSCSAIKQDLNIVESMTPFCAENHVKAKAPYEYADQSRQAGRGALSRSMEFQRKK